MKTSISRKKDRVIMAQLYASKPFWILNLKVTLLSFFQKKKKNDYLGSMICMWDFCSPWLMHFHKSTSLQLPQSAVKLAKAHQTNSSLTDYWHQSDYLHTLLLTVIHSFLCNPCKICHAVISQIIHPQCQVNLTYRQTQIEVTWAGICKCSTININLRSAHWKWNTHFRYASTLFHCCIPLVGKNHTYELCHRGYKPEETRRPMPSCTVHDLVKLFHKRTKQLLKLGAETPKTWTASELVKTL